MLNMWDTYGGKEKDIHWFNKLKRSCEVFNGLIRYSSIGGNVVKVKDVYVPNFIDIAEKFSKKKDATIYMKSEISSLLCAGLRMSKGKFKENYFEDEDLIFIDDAILTIKDILKEE